MNTFVALRVSCGVDAPTVETLGSFNNKQSAINTIEQEIASVFPDLPQKNLTNATILSTACKNCVVYSRNINDNGMKEDFVVVLVSSDTSDPPSKPSSKGKGVYLSQDGDRGVRCRDKYGHFTACPSDLEAERVEEETEEGHGPRKHGKDVGKIPGTLMQKTREGTIYLETERGRGVRCRYADGPRAGEFVDCPPRLEAQRLSIEEANGHGPRSRSHDEEDEDEEELPIVRTRRGSVSSNESGKYTAKNKVPNTPIVDGIYIEQDTGRGYRCRYADGSPNAGKFADCPSNLEKIRISLDRKSGHPSRR